MYDRRVFSLWYYTVSHGTLVIRSPKSKEHANTIDYIFSDVKHLNCPEKMTGLQVAAVETQMINAIEYTKYELHSDEGVFFIVALHMSCVQTRLDAMDIGPYMVGERSLSQEIYCYSVSAPVEGKGRFTRVVGGKGNFAELHIRLEAAKPVPGSIRFEGGIEVPSEYFPGIRSALYECRQNWIDFPVPASGIDIVVTGGVHLEVDASHFAYRQAAILAWQDAAARAGRLGLLDVLELTFKNNEALYKKLESDKIPSFLRYNNT